MRNRENIPKREDRVRLIELLAANRKLFTVYVLKDDLKHLWAYRYQGAALRFWKDWYGRAIRSRIEPLKRFARNLHAYLYGILAYCRWPLHPSLLEVINNKIKVIKRMAYGFRRRLLLPQNPRRLPRKSVMNLYLHTGRMLYHRFERTFPPHPGRPHVVELERRGLPWKYLLFGRRSQDSSPSIKTLLGERMSSPLCLAAVYKDVLLRRPRELRVE